MKDLHSHYIFGVDDGAKTIDSTRRMLAYANDAGIKDIMMTPHYIKESQYVSNKHNNMAKFIEIKEIALEYGINVYLGNEIFICPELTDLIRSEEVATLNNSKYFLVELPMNTRLTNAKVILEEALDYGYIPILAHPERYTCYYDCIEFFQELHDMGVLMQVNGPSIIGLYGRRAKSMAKRLLKANLIEFIGSDIHSSKEKKYDKLDVIEHKIKRYCGKERANDILFNNFDKVIKNEDI